MKKIVSLISLLLAILLFSACGSSPAVKATPAPTAPTRSMPSVIEEPVPTERPKDGLKSDGKIHVYIVGDGETVLTPESSFIRYITYYPESDHLIINMNGKDYAFSNISNGLWEDFKNADSKGTFYNDYIRDNSAYLIKDYSSGDGDKIVVEYIDSEQPSISKSYFDSSYFESEYDYEPEYDDSYRYYDEWIYCESCEEPMLDVNAVSVREGSYFICEDCYEWGDYRACDGCDIVHYVDDIYDVYGGYYCENCLDNYDY